MRDIHTPTDLLTPPWNEVLQLLGKTEGMKAFGGADLAHCTPRPTLILRHTHTAAALAARALPDAVDLEDLAHVALGGIGTAVSVEVQAGELHLLVLLLTHDAFASIIYIESRMKPPARVGSARIQISARPATPTRKAH